MQPAQGKPDDIDRSLGVGPPGHLSLLPSLPVFGKLSHRQAASLLSGHCLDFATPLEDGISSDLHGHVAIDEPLAKEVSTSPSASCLCLLQPPEVVQFLVAETSDSRTEACLR